MSAQGGHSTDEKDAALDMLRDLLLSEDRAALARLKNQINDPEVLFRLIEPIINTKLEVLKKEFPDEFGPIIAKTIEKRITEQKDEIVDILYPIIGRMISKYLAHEFQKLRDNIDSKIKQVFSFKESWKWIKKRLAGVSVSDILLSEYAHHSIVEIYVVQHHSGIQKGRYSRQETLDSDVVTGMLTAIKAFVEDAFNRKGKNEELEMIDYGQFKIIIQNFYNYYIALVVEGTLSIEEKEQLLEAVATFAEKERILLQEPINDQSFATISQKLTFYFAPSATNT